MQLLAEDLKKKLENKENLFLLDVRSPDEFRDWKINGAVNIPVNELKYRKEEIPKNKEIVTICAHGVRSKVAASQLQNQGYKAVSVFGGMAAWNSVYDVALMDEKDFRLLQLRRLGKGCIGYLIVSNGEAAAIDVSSHTDEFIKAAEKNRAKITKVIDTHQHADHVSGARDLAEKTKAKLYLNPLDAYLFSGFNKIKNKERIPVGNIELECIHTPGHTKGSTSFLIKNKFLLTGDILFVDGLARPDLRDKANEFCNDLFSTYHDKILKLKESTMIFPAHYSPRININFAAPLTATLNSVIEMNSALELSKSEFIKSILSNIPQKPPNYEYIINANKGEIELLPDEVEQLEEGPNRCVVKG